MTIKHAFQEIYSFNKYLCNTNRVSIILGTAETRHEIQGLCADIQCNIWTCITDAKENASVKMNEIGNKSS